MLNNLLGDPLLTARMVSGLGGPPPQLEWLLDADPMAKLFRHGDDDPAEEPRPRQIRYDNVARLDGVLCVSVVASVGDESYRFWIDRKRSCIKTVELPASIAGQQVEMEGWTVKSLELELKHASFEPFKESFQLANMPGADFPANPKYVRAMIPLPPAPPHRRLGATLPSFSVADRSGRVNVNAEGYDAPLTLWLVGQSSESSDPGLETVTWIQNLSSGLERAKPEIRQRLRPVVLAEATTVETLMRAGVDKTRWVVIKDREFDLAEQMGLNPGDVMLSDESRRILWIGDARLPSDVASLTGVAADTLAGIDVPQRLRQQWRSDQQAYQRKLQQVRYPAP